MPIYGLFKLCQKQDVWPVCALVTNSLGSGELIGGLDWVKNSVNSYPLDHLQIAAGTAVFDDKAHFDKTCNQVIESRVWLAEQPENLGFNALSSVANFLIV
jgi:histidinol-phosphate aminotransferase